MTKTQAARLQLQWKQREDRRPCQHQDAAVEHGEEVYITATHYCTLCGQVLLRVFKDSHTYFTEKLKKASVSLTLSQPPNTRGLRGTKA